MKLSIIIPYYNTEKYTVELTQLQVKLVDSIMKKGDMIYGKKDKTRG